MFDYIKHGVECADTQNVTDGMKQLREATKDYKTKADYVAFMRSVMPIEIEEANDGIVLHLHKQSCTCINSQSSCKKFYTTINENSFLSF